VAVSLLAAGCSSGSAEATRVEATAASASAVKASSGPEDGPVIQVSTSHCGQGWANPHAGEQTLSLTNTGGVSAEAYLVDIPGGAVHAELEGLAPGVTRPMRVTLGAGTYAIRCLADGSDSILGPQVRITGGIPGGPAVTPVTYNDLYAPAQAYRSYVSDGLKMLGSKTKALTSAVDRGDLKAARAAWLPAHLAYESLGAAYGTFGDFDGEIDGRPAGLPEGVRDPEFTGFHRVEYGLWHGQSAKTLWPIARRLNKDVQALIADFPDERLDPSDLPLRTHEILEGTLEFELTGRADEGSGTTLATAYANLKGTRKAVDVLRPLLRPRYSGLAQVDSLLDRVGELLESHRHGDRWTPVERLDPKARESTDGAVGELLERLAPIATICFPRRTS
jgi:iron uptake system component EfeO